MVQWFNKQPRWLQVVLLLVPFVNWIVELIIRWSKFADTKKVLHLVMAILVTIPSGIAIGIIDAICCIVMHHMLFVD